MSRLAQIVTAAIQNSSSTAESDISLRKRRRTNPPRMYARFWQTPPSLFPEKYLTEKRTPFHNHRLAAHDSKQMSLLANVERVYGELRRNKWVRWFAVFCRVVLALGFIPASW